MIGHPHTHPTATHTADDPMFGWVGAAPGAMNDMGMSLATAGNSAPTAMHASLAHLPSVPRHNAAKLDAAAALSALQPTPTATS